MKDLIARQLYQPAVVLPLLLLTRLMVSHDFNLTQVMFVVMLKGSQQAFHFMRDAMPRLRGGDVRDIACRHCC
jgi:type IV secretory pathway VirB3-like protein